jgi:hypothetical protein
MIHRPTREPRAGAMTGVWPSTSVESVPPAREVASDPDTTREEWQLDEVLADSFPASDPPPWTLGVVHASLPPRT